MAGRHDETLERRLRLPVLLLAAVLVYGTVGYMVIGWSFVDALYMTVITLSTVGFREVRPLDDAGKIFTISVVVLGVTILLITLTLAAVWVAEGVLSEHRRWRRMQKRIDRMKNHYIVCAFGRVGRTIAREFKSEEVPFVVVEPDDGLEERMIEDEVTYMIADPSQEHVLRAAGAERARGLICAVDSDATNVFITLMARSLNPNLFIVARASARPAVARLEQAGADRVISPYVTSGRSMARMALRPRIVGYLDMVMGDGGGPVRIEEISIEPGSSLVGRTLGSVCGGATLLAVRHADGSVAPHPPLDATIEEGDLLVLLGEDEVLRPVEGGDR